MTTESFMARFGARLVDNGYPVIPIQPGTKKPGRFQRGAWGEYAGWNRHCERATTLQEVEVWSQWPDCGIGIAGGAVAAIDIDVGDADVAATIDQLARDRLGDTPAVRIGRAPKRLLVYRTEAPFKGIRCSPIEVLCRGQQFVAYAIHPDTAKPYAWPEESLVDLSLGSLPMVSEDRARAFVADALELLPERIRPTRLARPARTPIAVPQPAGDLRGTREAVSAALGHIPNADLPYDDWVRIGMALKGALGDDGATLFEAWSAESAKNDPTFTAKTWSSFRPTAIGAGTIYHLAMERGWRPDPALVLNGTVASDDQHPAAGLIAKTAPTPSAPAMPIAPPRFSMTDPGGILGDLVGYMLETARRPQPVLALGAGLSALGALMGRKYRTASNLRSNLYVVGIADSGSGKNHAREIINELFVEARLGHYLGGNKIASGAGLLTAIHRQPAILFQLDEFGRFLRTIGDPKKAPHLFNVLTAFMKFYSSADTFVRGKAYADAKRNKSVDQPCVVLYGTTVPDSFWESMTSESLSDGFIGRLLVFESPERPKRQRRARVAPPQSVVDRVRWWSEFVPGGNLHKEHPRPLVVTATPEASARFDALADHADAEMEAKGEGIAAVWSRAEEKACRLALIYACSANPEEPVIDERAAAWACELSAYVTKRLLFEAHVRVADGQFDARQKRVLRLIVEHGGTQGISHTQLLWKTRWLSVRERQEVVENLIATGQINVVRVATKGRSATRYVSRA